MSTNFSAISFLKRDRHLVNIIPNQKIRQHKVSDDPAGAGNSCHGEAKRPISIPDERLNRTQRQLHSAVEVQSHRRRREPPHISVAKTPSDRPPPDPPPHLGGETAVKILREESWRRAGIENHVPLRRRSRRTVREEGFSDADSGEGESVERRVGRGNQLDRDDSGAPNFRTRPELEAAWNFRVGVEWHQAVGELSAAYGWAYLWIRGL